MNDTPRNGDELKKSLTGIAGFDAITNGGLPQNRTTILMGGPGTGKTVFALQTLVNGAVQRDVPGIFIAFEENAKQVVANAAGFGWDLAELQKQKKLFFIDARPTTDVICNGDFTLNGMLAVIDAKIAEMKAGQVVFDSIDLLLSLLDNQQLQRRESYRLRDWLAESGLTGLITIRAYNDHAEPMLEQFHFLEFMADCTIMLSQRASSRMALRELRINKYRGSRFEENTVPLIISTEGIVISNFGDQEIAPRADINERVSTGVQTLDDMLGGGFYRQSSTWVSGTPGTGKTTLAAAFADAACRRGESTLLFLFDQEPRALLRDLLSVNIDLAPHIASGLLHVHSTRKLSRSAEEQLFSIKQLIAQHEVRCMSIDSLSVPLSHADGDVLWFTFVEQLLHFSVTHGITLLCTAVPYPATTTEHHSWAQISSIVDTWIELSYTEASLRSPYDGNRRGLRITKSHGTSHSTAVHEMILSNEGVIVTASEVSVRDAEGL